MEDLFRLTDYDIILITGGEPTVIPEKTLSLILEIRRAIGDVKSLYLYTALFSKNWTHKLIDATDGITYTLHDDCSDAEVDNFIQFQEMIGGVRVKSHRLNLGPNIAKAIPIRPSVWKRIKVKNWFSPEEQHIPENETLFMLNPLK
jgi:hypothetical protein